VAPASPVPPLLPLLPPLLLEVLQLLAHEPAFACPMHIVELPRQVWQADDGRPHFWMQAVSPIAHAHSQLKKSAQSVLMHAPWLLHALSTQDVHAALTGVTPGGPFTHDGPLNGKSELPEPPPLLLLLHATTPATNAMAADAAQPILFMGPPERRNDSGIGPRPIGVSGRVEVSRIRLPGGSFRGNTVPCRSRPVAPPLPLSALSALSARVPRSWWGCSSAAVAPREAAAARRTEAAAAPSRCPRRCARRR
jgi:hypothetical protein